MAIKRSEPVREPEKPIVNIDPADYPSNSITQKNEPKRQRTSGTVKRSSGSIGSGIARALVTYVFPVVTSLVSEILMPAIKDGISDLMVNAVDTIIYGESAQRNISRGGSTNISYGDFYKSSSSRRRGKRSIRRSTSSGRLEDILIKDRGEAQEVLDSLGDTIREYGSVSVADLYEMTAIQSTWADANIGWRDISQARVVRDREGWLLKLPPYISLV